MADFMAEIFYWKKVWYKSKCKVNVSRNAQKKDDNLMLWKFHKVALGCERVWGHEWAQGHESNVLVSSPSMSVKRANSITTGRVWVSPPHMNVVSTQTDKMPFIGPHQLPKFWGKMSTAINNTCIVKVNY